jgi:dihydroflavonol-4-reductase
MGGGGGLKVLITGGTGFLGSRLTIGALERGWRVSVLTRRPETPQARAVALAGARLLLGDVTDRESLQRALDVAQPLRLLHSAGWVELGIPPSARRRMRAVNVDGVENVISLAVENGVERVVYVSSTTALGDTGGLVADERFERGAPPRSWYEATKAEAHALALRHQQMGEPLVIAAPAQVVGPGDHSAFGVLARLFVRRQMPPLGWGPEGAFTFAHVEDVAQAVLAVSERGRIGETYFLGGETLTVRQLMEVWRHVERRRPVWVWLPRPLAMVQAALLTPFFRLAGQPAFLSTEVVRSGYASFRYSSAKAIGELRVGFRPAARAWEETLKSERAIIRRER